MTRTPGRSGPTTPAAGAALTIGAVLLLVGNTAHPIDGEPTPLSRLDLATGPSWVGIHLVIAAGVLAVAAGFVLLSREAQVASRLAALGGVIGGVLMATVFAALDGYGMHTLAEEAATAGPVEREQLESATIALDTIDTGLAGLGTLIMMGLTMFAIAWTVRVTLASRWIASMAAVVGALGSTTGVALLLNGATPATINVLLRPTAVAFTVTVLLLGIRLWRSASTAAKPEPVHSRDTRTPTPQ